MEISRQTSSLPLTGQLPVRRDAPFPHSLQRGTFRGRCSGCWRAQAGPPAPGLRPVLLYVGVVVALGGLGATFEVSSTASPLLALPRVVLLLLYLRGLYRRRLRALCLDGVVPVISAVSVGADGGGDARTVRQRPMPNQDDWLETWLCVLVGLGLSRIVLTLAQRFAR